MNSLLLSLGIESWKPLLTALLLPPVPLLVLLLIGVRWVPARRGLGWLVVGASVFGLWFGATVVAGEALQRWLLAPPPPLTDAQLVQLQRKVAARTPVAIVVLGAGRDALAPEYGLSSLPPLALERLRYGLWLSRATGAPVGFSGGLGHAQEGGPMEADIAARIAEREFGRPLRWLENASRDTRENGARMVGLLRAAGVTEVVLVTHAWHMPRAQRAFEEAARASGGLRIVPAPMGLAPRITHPALRWMPSHEGFAHVRQVWREKLGWWMGA